MRPAGQKSCHFPCRHSRVAGGGWRLFCPLLWLRETGTEGLPACPCEARARTVFVGCSHQEQLFKHSIPHTHSPLPLQAMQQRPLIVLACCSGVCPPFSPRSTCSRCHVLSTAFQQSIVDYWHIFWDFPIAQRTQLGLNKISKHLSELGKYYSCPLKLYQITPGHRRFQLSAELSRLFLFFSFFFSYKICFKGG